MVAQERGVEFIDGPGQIVPRIYGGKDIAMKALQDVATHCGYRDDKNLAKGRKAFDKYLWALEKHPEKLMEILRLKAEGKKAPKPPRPRIIQDA